MCVFLFADKAFAQANWIWPISGSQTPDPINSPFGPRSLTAAETYDFHRGLDISVPIGTDVHAMEDGTIHFSGAGGTGPYTDNSVVLRHEIGGTTYFTYYTHLATFTTLSAGDLVNTGDVIGTSGQESASYPHLHFELRETANLQKNALHPLAYLNYPDSGAPAFSSTIDYSNPTNPLVSLSIDLDKTEVDLLSVGVEIYTSGGALTESHSYDMHVWNQSYSATDLDNPSFNGVEVSTARFATSPNYDITFLFDELSLPATQGQWEFRLTATDVSGNTFSESHLVPEPSANLLLFTGLLLSGIYVKLGRRLR